MTLRLASLAQGKPPRLASLAQGRLLRFMATWTVAFLISGGASVLACPLCFGAEETSLVDGTKLGVLALLAVTLTIEGLFVAFFLYLRRRAKRIAEADFDTEWSELQRSRS